MDVEEHGVWTLYVNPVLTLAKTRCDGETAEGEPCPFQGRYLAYNEGVVMDLHEKGAFPATEHYCADHLPEDYEVGLDEDRGLRVVDLENNECDKSKVPKTEKGVNPKDLSESFSEVQFTSKGGKSEEIHCTNTATIRMFDSEGGFKDYCLTHARDPWVEALEPNEDDEEDEIAAGGEA